MGRRKYHAAVRAIKRDGFPEGRNDDHKDAEHGDELFMNSYDVSRASVVNSIWLRFIKVGIAPRPHNYLAVLFVVLMLVSMDSRAHSADRYGFQIKKDTELQQIRPRKPVKIKLKRTGKNGYIWELTGDDADEIIKTDRKLRELLNE